MTCWKLSFFGKECFDCGCGKGEVDLSGEAFGLPPKTVRASLAFLVTGVTFCCFVGAIVVLAVHGKYDLMVGVLAAVTNIASIILGYYFGSRSATNSEKKRFDNRRVSEHDAEMGFTASTESDS